jgi:hypothetical protein
MGGGRLPIHRQVWVRPRKTASCDYVSAILDDFASSTPVEKRIFLVSYKGIRETNNSHVEKRLQALASHFSKYYKGTPRFRPTDRLILTIGVKRTEQGKVEFYVDGIIGLTLLFRNDTDLNLPPCYR